MFNVGMAGNVGRNLRTATERTLEWGIPRWENRLPIRDETTNRPLRSHTAHVLPKKDQKRTTAAAPQNVFRANSITQNNTGNAINPTGANLIELSRSDSCAVKSSKPKRPARHCVYSFGGRVFNVSSACPPLSSAKSGRRVFPSARRNRLLSLAKLKHSRPQQVTSSATTEPVEINRSVRALARGSPGIVSITAAQPFELNTWLAASHFRAHP